MPPPRGNLVPFQTPNVGIAVGEPVPRRVLQQSPAPVPPPQRRPTIAEQAQDLELKGITKGGFRFGQPDEPARVGAKLITEIAKVPNILENIQNLGTIFKQVPSSQQGPILGRLSQSTIAPIAGSLIGDPNIVNAAQSAQSFSKAVTQEYGRYMEGGVLRKEDEIKYFLIMPNLSEPVPVQNFKGAILQRMLIQRYNTDISALKNAGFDVGNFKKLEIPPLPRIPGAFRKIARETTNAANSLQQSAGIGIWRLGDGRRVRAKNITQANKLRSLGAVRDEVTDAATQR